MAVPLVVSEIQFDGVFLAMLFFCSRIARLAAPVTARVPTSATKMEIETAGLMIHVGTEAK